MGTQSTWGIPYLDFENNHGSVNASLAPGTSQANTRHPKALSTSFEKTCMRQIHCHDRLNAMVNKGPYHAQGLFKLKRTRCLRRNVPVILECAFLILETCVVMKSCNASKSGRYMAFSCKMIAKKKNTNKKKNAKKSIRTEARTRVLSRV